MIQQSPLVTGQEIHVPFLLPVPRETVVLAQANFSLKFNSSDLLLLALVPARNSSYMLHSSRDRVSMSQESSFKGTGPISNWNDW